MNKRKGLILKKMFMKPEEVRVLEEHIKANNVNCVGIMIKEIVERGDYVD